MKNAYLKALRAPFLAGSVIPVIIGTALAFKESEFVFLYLIVTLVGVAGLHLGANLINDYYDAGGSDPFNFRVTPFSGGSRVIQNKELTRDTVRTMALFFFAIGVVSGLWFVFNGRPLVLLIGMMGLVAGWAYSAPPLQLMSRGWGEILIFFAFGPLVTLGTFYVMSGFLDDTGFLLGIPQGFFITGVIWINQFPDYEADRKAGKNNLVVRLTPEISRYFYCAIMLMAYASVVIMVFSKGLSPLTLISVLSFPLAFKAMRILWRQYLSVDGIIPAQALTIQALITHGLLLSLAIWLGRFF
jgi:1,4-dihydroxy-2-naphthoate octaprenyltransferase